MKVPIARRLLAALLPAFVAVLLLAPERAAAVDGRALLTQCKSTEATIDDLAARSWCLGYIAGIAEFTATFDLDICIPGSPTHAELAEVVMQWLEDRPDLQRFGAAWASFEALSEAYPCE